MRKSTAVGWLISTIACLVGCAAQPERIAQTPSGRPEVVIHTDDTDLVKAEIINEMQTLGFFLRDDSKYRLVFTKELEGSQAILTQLAIGNSYSTTPVGECAFNLSTTENGIRVVEFSSISTQMAMGQVRRMDMKGNNAWFNDLYTLLQRVKQRSENANAVASGQ